MSAPDFCDGCGTIMLEQPIVKRMVGDRTFVFDRFECYQLHNMALCNQKAADDAEGTAARQRHNHALQMERSREEVRV